MYQVSLLGFAVTNAAWAVPGDVVRTHVPRSCDRTCDRDRSSAHLLTGCDGIVLLHWRHHLRVMGGLLVQPVGHSPPVIPNHIRPRTRHTKSHPTSHHTVDTRAMVSADAPPSDAEEPPEHTNDR